MVETLESRKHDQCMYESKAKGLDRRILVGVTSWSLVTSIFS